MSGLGFDLSEEQEQLRQMVRDFAEREASKDVARKLEASREFPEDLARRIAKAGPNGIGIPEEYGGQGGDLRFAFAMTEPAGGTDVLRAMTTRAVPADGGCARSGRARWSLTRCSSPPPTFSARWARGGAR